MYFIFESHCTMDNKELQLLAVLETKLNMLLESAKRTDKRHDEIDNRIDTLEKLQARLTGMIAVLLFVSGTGVWAADAYLERYFRSELASTDLISLVCTQFKNGQRIAYEDLPTICR